MNLFIYIEAHISSAECPVAVTSIGHRFNLYRIVCTPYMHCKLILIVLTKLILVNVPLRFLKFRSPPLAFAWGLCHIILFSKLYL